MPRNRFFDPIIRDYIRDRLLDECKVRGVAADIARETNTSRAHIANILDGTRRVGEEFAAAIAKYWRVSQLELHRLAYERHGSKSADSIEAQVRTHPNLDITLEFCRGVYPESYLLGYEQTARQQPDRPKMEWLTEIHTGLYAWMSRQAPNIQKRYLHLLGVPLPSFATFAAFASSAPSQPTRAAGRSTNLPDRDENAVDVAVRAKRRAKEP